MNINVRNATRNIVKFVELLKGKKLDYALNRIVEGGFTGFQSSLGILELFRNLFLERLVCHNNELIIKINNVKETNPVLVDVIRPEKLYLSENKTIIPKEKKTHRL